MSEEARTPGRTDRRGPCPCGSGKKYKSCCFAKDRAVEETLDAARATHRVIDELLGELLALVESRGEYKVACRAGCNACCVSFVRITPAQAELLARWLLEPEHAHLLARYRDSLPRWRAAIGPEVDAIEELLAAHGGLPPDGPDRARYLDAVATYDRRRLMCPFNDEHGNCAIYPVRPMPCRTWNVVGTADNCGPDPPAPPQAILHPRLTETIAEARAVLDRVTSRSGKPTAERVMMRALADALRDHGVTLDP